MNSPKIYNKMLFIAQNISKIFPKFYLAGGTAIMFRYKHRLSEDLDFLSYQGFSFLMLSQKVRKNFNVEKEERFTDNIDFWIEGIKVSFVFFPFINIDQCDRFNSVRIASDYDLFLNKIYTAGRRIEPKDPFDFAFLYRKYDWGKEKVKEDFERKFPSQSFNLYLGALLNIDDYPEIDTKTKTVLVEVIERWT